MITKGLFLSALLLSVHQLVAAQDTTTYQFCEIHIYKKSNDKVTIALDDGSKPYSILRGDNFIEDNAGEKVEFNSPMDCANAMSENGWQYVEAHKYVSTGLLIPIMSIVFKRPAYAPD